MAAKTAVTAKTLEALGAARLAELLVEVSAGNATAKRRLRLELAAAKSPGDVAKEVRKRLTTIARSRSVVDWQGVRSLAGDLDLQRSAIVETVAKTDATEALDLLWRFMALAPTVFDRRDDSSGTVIGVFCQACRDLGEVASSAGTNPTILADRAYEALLVNDYGQFDELIRVLAPALGQAGLEHLKRRMIDLSNRPTAKPAEKARVKIGWSSAGPIYADEMAERSRVSTVRLALTEIADMQGDVDAFIAQYEKETRKVPKIAAEIARRLLSAGRVNEAWQAISAAEHRRRNGGWNWPDFEWENARIEVLDALGRADDAQAARWSCFERSLSSSHLRAYPKRLPDFDDIEAETKALEYAKRFGSLLQALSFLVSWPALDRAGDLVLQRADELDGDHYEVMTPAAEALTAKYPLAWTVVLRAMIDFSLRNARSSRYRHAARHLLDCSSLAPTIKDYRQFEPHAAYEANLRRQHGKKSSFWSFVD